jgi:uncharacterized membrane protein
MVPNADKNTPSDREASEARQREELVAIATHSIVDSIVVNAPVAPVYARCVCFEQLPRFVTSLREVEKIDDTHFSLISIVGGEERKAVLQIVLRIPERRIVWRTMSESFPHGVVLFEPPSDRTTQVIVRMRSSIDSAILVRVTREYLTNFKRIVENELMQ